MSSFLVLRNMRPALRRSLAQPGTLVLRGLATQEGGRDKFYTPSNEVPEHIIKNMGKQEAFSPGFSIKGEAEAGRALYLDMQATTPMDPRVLDAMLPHMLERYGNPHSKTHAYGWEAEAAVEAARAEVAALVGADPKEIVFTSGATESNNLSIKGAMRFFRERKRHVITTQTEHKCVLDSCRQLEQEGFEVTYLPVQENGLIRLEELAAALRPDTGVVSVMAVNNEIGVLQPLKEIGEMCRANKTFFHTDAAQMLGKMPINVDDLKIDLMSLSSHKIYGPKGIGALTSWRAARVRLEPLMSGGGQEAGPALGHALATPSALLTPPWLPRLRRSLPRGQRGDGLRHGLGGPPQPPAEGRHPEPDPRGGAQRGPGGSVPGQPQLLLQLRGGGVAADGREEHGGVLRLGLHLRLPRALLRPPRHRHRRGAGALLHPVRPGPLHHRGRGRLCCGPPRQACDPAP
ncbi:unnamed protein product [Heterosigma akashiwo]